MLPDIPQIRDSLAAVSVEETSHASSDPSETIICDKTNRKHSDGTLARDRSVIVLKQAKNAPITLGTLTQRVADELNRNEHAHVGPKLPYRDTLTSKLIAMATIISKSLGEEPLSSMNQVLNSICITGVTQWAILANNAEDNTKYEFSDFELGILDLHLLRRKSERVASDFFAHYGDRLRNRLALCRDSRSILVVDIKKSLDEIKSPSLQSLLYRVMNEYFNTLAESERLQFFLDLDRTQAIYGAVGLGTISSDYLQRTAMYTFWVTVFSYSARGNGWVVPSENYPISKITTPKALADSYKQINSSLHLNNWGSRALDDVLQTFAEYLNTARNYEDDGRVEEALLHSVFALDLLLGGNAKDSLTAKLADRAAILSHLALGQEFAKVVTFVRETYDMRSAYVHRGMLGKLAEGKKETVIDQFSRLRAICQAVLGAACFARNQPWCEGQDARTVWLGRIDILRTKLQIGQGLDPSDVQDLGLDRIALGEGRTDFISIKD